MEPRVVAASASSRNISEPKDRTGPANEESVPGVPCSLSSTFRDSLTVRRPVARPDGAERCRLLRRTAARLDLTPGGSSTAPRTPTDRRPPLRQWAVPVRPSALRWRCARPTAVRCCFGTESTIERKKQIMHTKECLSLSEEMTLSAMIKSITLGYMTGNDIEKYSSINITEISDLTSPKLGLPNHSSECETCASSTIKNCDGHFGSIKLPAVIYHPNFISEIVEILNQICPGCKSIRHLQKPGKRSFMGGGEYIKPDCKYCLNRRKSNQWYPRMKFKILKDKKDVSIVVEVNERLPKKFKRMVPTDVLAKDYWDFVPRYMPEQGLYCATAMILSPSQAFYILKELDKEFIEKHVSRREQLFLSCIPVTSNCHRVTERILPHINGPELIFDERSKAYRTLVSSKRKVDDLQVHCHPYGGGIFKNIGNIANSCLSSSNLHISRSKSTERASTLPGLKWIKEIILGKRSDHTFSMVVVGDPRVKLWEIGVPCDLSKRLLVAETVTKFNREKLNRNSGISYTQKKENYRSNRIAPGGKNTFHVGDALYRPLQDGDTVLVNRPPSVHQHSLIAFRVKILPGKSVISINPLCCAPFKGDFDGDFLLGYVPQSIQCRVELDQLASIECQLFNGQDGKNLLFLSHDSLTAAYLLTGTDVFLNKFQMQQLQMLCPRQLECPAVIKSASNQLPIWTGRQLFSSFLPSTFNFASNSEDVFIKNGELLLSPTESFWLQNKTTGLFSSLFKNYGGKALDFLHASQEVLCEWISDRGFSVTLNDLYLCSDQYSRKKLTDEVDNGLQEAKHAFHTNDILMVPQIGSLLKEYSGCNDLIRMASYEMARSRCSKQKSGFMNKLASSAFKEVFQDLQTVIHRFARKDNSMLQMIHAGSKGSFTKLFQQSACLGLQEAANFSYFQLSSMLPFDLWNPQKSSNVNGVTTETPGIEGSRSCTVIENSFLDGLNPIQCLLHAASARANFFSENAEIPGTLNRKLMFQMRDLYMAYDGTIRNCYGQQVVQFPYDVSNNACIDINDKFCTIIGYSNKANGSGGQPTGALASCAISEAAYGGLDQPTSIMESSPLINFKRIFNGCQKGASSMKTVSLALSSKLNRWNYGFEYAALEVQDHLERVVLSDVVDTILIAYAGQEVKGSVRPWISHFHLNKQRMLRRRTTIQHIADVLERQSNLFEGTTNRLFSKLHVLNRKCILADGQGDDDAMCLTVAVESSGFVEGFDDIRNFLIPRLLQTVIKGFIEYEKVEILWDEKPNSPRMGKESSGELFLKVTVSNNFKTKKLWSDLQNSCLPVMDLIDWERSHPDNICDIINSHGIGSAWKYFLQNLKTATADLGRSVHEQHLLLVADCLTVTGQFSGLTDKGIKAQRIHSGIQSPFVQACSVRPAKTFISAAKEGATDYLLGTVDALAWGKQVPVGTGGSFDIIYPREAVVEQRIGCDHITGNLKICLLQVVHEFKKSENIYQALAKHPNVRPDDRSATRLSNCDRLSAKSVSDKNRAKHSTISGLDKCKSQSSSKSEPNKGFVGGSNRLQKILHENPINCYLNKEDMAHVMMCLQFHPNSAEKIGSGAQGIKIGFHPKYPDSRCFLLVRNDGTTEDFSYHKCITGAANRSSANPPKAKRRAMQRPRFKER